MHHGSASDRWTAVGGGGGGLGQDDDVWQRRWNGTAGSASLDGIAHRGTAMGAPHGEFQSNDYENNVHSYSVIVLQDLFVFYYNISQTL